MGIIIADIATLHIWNNLWLRTMRPNLDISYQYLAANPPCRMFKEPYVASEGVKETRSRGGSPSSSASHQKFTASYNGRACTITSAFCYPYLVACTRSQTEGEDNEGRRGRRGVVAGGWNREKKRGQDRSKMGSHSPGPFLLYWG